MQYKKFVLAAGFLFSFTTLNAQAQLSISDSSVRHADYLTGISTQEINSNAGYWSDSSTNPSDLTSKNSVFYYAWAIAPDEASSRQLPSTFLLIGVALLGILDLKRRNLSK